MTDTSEDTEQTDQHPERTVEGLVKMAEASGLPFTAEQIQRFKEHHDSTSWAKSPDMNTTAYKLKRWLEEDRDRNRSKQAPAAKRTYAPEGRPAAEQQSTITQLERTSMSWLN